MKERTWTIGSLPGCDIRVDSPTVSGRHCRLTQRGQTFVLEDLASTNGTFVAGERIHEPRGVRRGEQITLGRNTPMPWPNLCSITVGRLPDNDVVVPLDVVSGRHARLEREGNRVLLIDLELEERDFAQRSAEQDQSGRDPTWRRRLPGDAQDHGGATAGRIAQRPAGSRAGAARHENRGRRRPPIQA